MADHNKRNVRYDYDSVGNQTVVSTEMSETHYTYDSLKRQMEVIAKGAPNSKQQESITKILYNGYDLEQKIYPNNLVMHLQYDLIGRLTQVEQTDVDFKEFIRLVERHHYDPQGNATLEYKVDWFDNTLSENVKYQYDTLNRLTTATETRGKFNRDYTYDTLGNLVEETDKSYYNDSITVYSIDELNRLTGKETTNILQDKTREKALFTYEFDQRGNMIAEVNELSGSRQSYTYDLTNRMVEGISHEKRTSSYQFNGLGSLVAWASSSPVGERPALVSHGRNAHTKEYLLDYTQQVPQELLEIQERRNTAYSYLGRDKLTSITATPLEKMILNYHHDMLGSVRYATDQQGQVQLSNIYSEWGEPRVTQRNKGEVGQPSYTGHMFDDVLGVYYAKARVYDQVNKRFGAEDLVKGVLQLPSTINAYLYTVNNPLIGFDPDGLKVWLVHGTMYPFDTRPPLLSRSDGSTEHWDDNFQEYLSELFNQDVYSHWWEGGNSKGSRTRGAVSLADKIEEWREDNPYCPIRIIGFSHGGNVAIETINILAERSIDVETLVTIGTPVRTDYRLTARVGQHVNIYNTRDTTQTMIGAGGILTTANRRFRSPLVQNVNTTAHVPSSLSGREAHSVMHDSTFIWERYIVEELGLTQDFGRAVRFPRQVSSKK